MTPDLWSEQVASLVVRVLPKSSATRGLPDGDGLTVREGAPRDGGRRAEDGGPRECVGVGHLGEVVLDHEVTLEQPLQDHLRPEVSLLEPVTALQQEEKTSLSLGCLSWSETENFLRGGVGKLGSDPTESTVFPETSTLTPVLRLCPLPGAPSECSPLPSHPQSLFALLRRDSDTSPSFPGTHLPTPAEICDPFRPWPDVELQSQRPEVLTVY